MNKKILIIDDETGFLETTAAIFEANGYETVKAITAEAGLEALASERPSVVLLDVNLPDKNGFEVLRVIKASKDFKSIPVILITGDTAVHVDRAFSEGADDCIFKPVDMDKLFADIDKIAR
ncbi:MAG: response regulator [Endomicrobium sp.]|jgi:DNA-binding response OmpR family regulator|nr:response regulator [Endomicrobium sp.]